MPGFRPVGTKPVATVGGPTVPAINVTQTFVEVTSLPGDAAGAVRVTAAPVEVGNSGAPDAVVTTNLAEVANSGDAYASVSQVFVEILSLVQRNIRRPKLLHSAM